MLQCNENQHTSHHFLPQLLYTHYNLQVTYSALDESWDGPLLDLVRELSDAQGEVKTTSTISYHTSSISYTLHILRRPHTLHALCTLYTLCPLYTLHIGGCPGHYSDSPVEEGVGRLSPHHGAGEQPGGRSRGPAAGRVHGQPVLP